MTWQATHVRAGGVWKIHSSSTQFLCELTTSPKTKTSLKEHILPQNCRIPCSLNLISFLDSLKCQQFIMLILEVTCLNLSFLSSRNINDL